MPDAGMVIIGGGKAGAGAAIGFRENGWMGAITVVSNESLLPYDRPPLSKSAITDDAEPQAVLLLDDSMILSLGVNFKGGAAPVEEEAFIVYCRNFRMHLNASGNIPHLKQRRLHVPNASE